MRAACVGAGGCADTADSDKVLEFERVVDRMRERAAQDASQR